MVVEVKRSEASDIGHGDTVSTIAAPITLDRINPTRGIPESPLATSANTSPAFAVPGPDGANATLHLPPAVAEFNGFSTTADNAQTLLATSAGLDQNTRTKNIAGATKSAPTTQTPAENPTSIDVFANTTTSNTGHPDVSGTARVADAGSGAGIGGVDRTANGDPEEPWNGRAAAEAILPARTLDQIDASEEMLRTAHSLVHSIDPSKTPRSNKLDLSFMDDQATAVEAAIDTPKRELITKERERQGPRGVSTTLELNADVYTTTSQAVESMEAKIAEISDRVGKIKTKLKALDRSDITQLSTLYTELIACVVEEPTLGTQRAIAKIYNNTLGEIKTLTATTKVGVIVNTGPPVTSTSRRVHGRIDTELTNQTTANALRGTISSIKDTTALVEDIQTRQRRVESGIPKSIEDLRAQEAEIHTLLRQAAGKLGVAEYTHLQALILESFAAVEADAAEIETVGDTGANRRDRASAAGRYFYETHILARENALELGSVHTAEVRNQGPSLYQLTTRLSALGPIAGEGREDTQPFEASDRLKVPDFNAGFDTTQIVTPEKLTEIETAIAEKIRQLPPDVVRVLGEDRVRELEMLPLVLAEVEKLYNVPDPFQQKHETTPPVIIKGPFEKLVTEADAVLAMIPVSRKYDPNIISNIRRLAKEIATITSSPDIPNGLPDVFRRVETTRDYLATIISRLPDKLKAAIESVAALDIQEIPQDIAAEELVNLARQRLLEKGDVVSGLDVYFEAREQPFTDYPGETLEDLQSVAQFLPTHTVLKELGKLVSKEQKLYHADTIVTSLGLSPEEQTQLNDLRDESRKNSFRTMLQNLGRNRDIGAPGMNQLSIANDAIQSTYERILEGILDKGRSDDGVRAAHRKAAIEGTDIDRLNYAINVSYIDLLGNGTTIYELIHDRLRDYAVQPRDILVADILAARRGLTQALNEIIGTDARGKGLTDEQREKIAALDLVRNYLISKLEDVGPLEKSLKLKVTDEDRGARSKAKKRLVDPRLLHSDAQPARAVRKETETEVTLDLQFDAAAGYTRSILVAKPDDATAKAEVARLRSPRDVDALGGPAALGLATALATGSLDLELMLSIFDYFDGEDAQVQALQQTERTRESTRYKDISSFKNRAASEREAFLALVDELRTQRIRSINNFFAGNRVAPRILADLNAIPAYIRTRDMLAGQFAVDQEREHAIADALTEHHGDVLGEAEIGILTAITTGTFYPDTFIDTVKRFGRGGKETREALEAFKRKHSIVGRFIGEHPNAGAALLATLEALQTLDERTRNGISGILDANGIELNSEEITEYIALTHELTLVKIAKNQDAEQKTTAQKAVPAQRPQEAIAETAQPAADEPATLEPPIKPRVETATHGAETAIPQIVVFPSPEEVTGEILAAEAAGIETSADAPQASLEAKLSVMDLLRMQAILGFRITGSHPEAITKARLAPMADYTPFKPDGEITEDQERQLSEFSVEEIPLDIKKPDLHAKAKARLSESERRRVDSGELKFDTDRLNWIFQMAEELNEFGTSVLQPNQSMLGGNYMILIIERFERYPGAEPETVILFESALSGNATYGVTARLAKAPTDFVARRYRKSTVRGLHLAVRTPHQSETMAGHHVTHWYNHNEIMNELDAAEARRDGRKIPVPYLSEAPRRSRRQSNQIPAAERVARYELPFDQVEAIIRSLPRVEPHDKRLHNYITADERNENELRANPYIKTDFFHGRPDNHFLDLFRELSAVTQNSETEIATPYIDIAKTAFPGNWELFLDHHRRLLREFNEVFEQEANYAHLMGHYEALTHNENASGLAQLLAYINHPVGNPLGLDSFGIAIDDRITDLLKEANTLMHAYKIDPTKFYNPPPRRN